MSDEEALAAVRAVRPLMRELGPGRRARARPLRVRAQRPALQALWNEDPRPRPGRRQPHDLLVPHVPGLIRVGHKGADHVAPGQTIESFEAALEHGVDMIETTLRTRDGRLVLAHDYETPSPATASRSRRASRISPARRTRAWSSTWT